MVKYIYLLTLTVFLIVMGLNIKADLEQIKTHQYLQKLILNKLLEQSDVEQKENI